ncbi:efflux RND transporter periplasmic adaptor subunit [Paenibacillus protaetiae]|uniref:Efflux RND transporter periplasmic adaptor subunit n=1 Tax=Paenibacillus protaetiae TaxID=2509456 RepID=A0A4P6EXV5_9BACL|nr:efflux RND transporter periplasmic adaptor subunit [Paenibacillus protaetiae]QAY65447.1 efflux RND transporter periplasmic adaptor subunit [Paenibacillus protaetiae]
MYTKWWTGSFYKGAAAAILCASLLFMSACSLLPDEAEEEVLPSIAPPQISKKPEYEVTTATLETKVQVVGKLLSTKEEPLYFPIGNKNLKTLYVKSGDTVTAGQPIGELDVDDLQKQLKSQQLDFRKEELSMKETLRNKDTMDPIEFEELSIAFEEKRQAIADLQEEIGKAQLVAPFAGTIMDLNVQKGDLITAYKQIGVLADTAALIPAAKLTKDQLSKVAVGMPVVANINSVGELKGTVKVLPLSSGSDSGNNGEQNLDRPEDYMQVELKDMPKGLTRGMPISISIIINRKENAVVIPPSTLRTIGSRTYVQVVDDSGKREVDVEVGQQTSTQIEILQGLTPGQKVVGR